MSSILAVAYLLLAVTLTRALLVKARLAPATCPLCGLPFERHRLGDPVCRCSRDDAGGTDGDGKD